MCHLYRLRINTPRVGTLTMPCFIARQQGACMVAPGGACMVAPGGGMHGCSGGAWLLPGGVHGCSGGACMVAPGAWLLGRVCGCSRGVVCMGYDDIRRYGQ